MSILTPTHIQAQIANLLTETDSPHGLFRKSRHGRPQRSGKVPHGDVLMLFHLHSACTMTSVPQVFAAGRTGVGEGIVPMTIIKQQK